jgi:hypothetical protein
MSRFLTLLVVLAALTSGVAQTTAQAKTRLSGPAASAQRKFEYIERNGASAHPDRKPTEVTEQELNAYLNSGAIKLPAGVHQVHLVGNEGVISGTANVNFDEVKEGRSSSNPLLSMFNGIHEVQFQAHAMGTGGHATVDVDSIALNGVNVPRMGLEFFIDHYLKPKYPGIGMHSTFALPDRIDTAIVGNHIITILQK